MCTRRLAVLVTLTVWLVGTHASAGALISATWQQTFQGVDLTITNGGAFCTASPGGSGQVIGCPSSGLGASGSSTPIHYSVGLTVPLFTLDQFALGGTLPIHTHASLSGAQLVTGTKSAATATMGVGGRATVKTAAHDKKSMYAPGMSSLLQVPLSVGKAGTFTNYFVVLGVLHYITVDFYAWTPLSITFEGVTSGHVPLRTPTVVAMGSFGLTALGGGTVTLVSPSKISIDGALAQRRTASFATLKLTYAPEPGLLLLLGAGAAGLVLAGSRKRS